MIPYTKCYQKNKDYYVYNEYTFCVEIQLKSTINAICYRWINPNYRKKLYSSKTLYLLINVESELISNILIYMKGNLI